MKIQKFLGLIFPTRGIKKIQAKEKNKSKSLENWKWSGHLQYTITWPGSISTKWYKICETRKSKKFGHGRWNLVPKGNFSENFEYPYLKKYARELDHWSYNLFLFHMGCNLKNFENFWVLKEFPWWRKIWIQALKNHISRKINCTAMWVGSLILWSLPLSYDEWLWIMKKFKDFCPSIFQARFRWSRREDLKNEISPE